MTEQTNEVNVKWKLIGYRKMANLTQGQVSKLLNINRSTYNKKENNPDLFTYEEQKKIQAILAERIKDCPRFF